MAVYAASPLNEKKAHQIRTLLTSLEYFLHFIFTFLKGKSTEKKVRKEKATRTDHLTPGTYITVTYTTVLSITATSWLNNQVQNPFLPIC